MKIIKYYRKPDAPIYARLVQVNEREPDEVYQVPVGWMLVNAPLDRSKGRQVSQWLDPTSVYIDWIREVRDETTNITPASQA